VPLFPVISHMNPFHTPHPISLRSILILYSYICLGLPSGFLPSGFPASNCIHFVSNACHMPHSSHVQSDCSNTVSTLRIMKLLVMHCGMREKSWQASVLVISLWTKIWAQDNWTMKQMLTLEWDTQLRPHWVAYCMLCIVNWYLKCWGLRVQHTKTAHLSYITCLISP
jgi:hypothetical protein